MQDELAELDVTEVEFDAMLANGEPVEVTGASGNQTSDALNPVPGWNLTTAVTDENPAYRPTRPSLS